MNERSSYCSNPNKLKFHEKEGNYVSPQIQSGDFENSSEVVGNTLQFSENYHKEIIEALRSEIAKGWDEPVSRKSIQDILKSR